MRREITPYELAGTIYTPAIHKDLQSVGNGIKYPDLKSVVFCLEDSIADSEVSLGKQNIKDFLTDYSPENLKVFIRIRNISNFYDVLDFPNIEKIDGFVIPKFDTFNMKDYVSLIRSKNLNKKFHFMITLETNDVFEINKLQAIRNMLLQFKRDVLTVRIGLEDLSKRLSLRRKCNKTAYDNNILSSVIANIIMTFKPSGFNVSAPVFSCFGEEYKETFIREAVEDLENGLIGKTIIHPSQAEIINEIYKVSEEDYALAKEIIETVKAVVGFKGQMLEKATNLFWAETTLKRAKIFGKN